MYIHTYISPGTYCTVPSHIIRRANEGANVAPQVNPVHACMCVYYVSIHLCIYQFIYSISIYLSLYLI